MSTTINIAAQLPSGDHVRLAFPLHPDTKDAATVAGLAQGVLEGLEQGRRKFGNPYSSDVLQALTIALATRALMINAPVRQVEFLTKDLLGTALAAAEETRERMRPRAAHS